jgi:hypothetical protein
MGWGKSIVQGLASFGKRIAMPALDYGRQGLGIAHSVVNKAKSIYGALKNAPVIGNIAKFVAGLPGVGEIATGLANLGIDEGFATAENVLDRSGKALDIVEKTGKSIFEGIKNAVGEGGGGHSVGYRPNRHH